ncbi:hypothetical protein IE53DRAFT_61261 [Violaceomyces palustris]|uniref:Uncharacterized protein n=1 Tax=Violaceomyces palustris TaxID=1673888 RepID=A0ACD0NZB3_9BASI|nr:hypothetical protein IE53DRAFT_61261 [Violaceomyces palustris]
MLSSDVCGTTPRPRPPASRRPSSQHPSVQARVAAGQRSSSISSSLNPDRIKPPVAPDIERSYSDPTPGGDSRMDNDLDLDLPEDLTAALERNASKWPGLRAARGPDFGNWKDDMGDHLPGATNHPDKASAECLGTNQHQTKPSFASACVALTVSEKVLSMEKATQDCHNPIQVTEVEDSSVLEHDEEGAGLGEPEDEDVLDTSLDRDWVGALGRDELEALLMQANQVIKERERDLGIAAAIGKALLEKNISLRSKHHGIMHRIASSTSIFMGDDSIASTHQAAPPRHPPYSPPTTDIDITSQSGHSRSNSVDDDTPIASAHEEDYFKGAALDNSTASKTSTLAGLPASPVAKKASRDFESNTYRNRHSPSVQSPSRQPWSPSSAGLIASQPASPSESIVSYSRVSKYDSERKGSKTSRSRPSMTFIQAAEAQRQLASLSEQNEALLQQLSELQSEAERAKKEGGKKLKRLNQEIGGLKAELEAATKRNDELEVTGGGAEDGDESGLSHPAGRSRRKPWQRRSNLDSIWSSTSRMGTPGRIVRPTNADDEHALPDSEASLRSNLREVGLPESSSSTAAISEMRSSASTLESMLGYAPGHSEGERALVAQLLAKIKELEDTNAAMAREGTEMDGKLGRAMEEGERLKDAYEAVEHAGGVASDDDDDDDNDHGDGQELSHEGRNNLDERPKMPSQPASPDSGSLAGLSPASIRGRRAPGNRYIIEGKRTIKAALRKERREARLVTQDAGISRSSTEGSLASLTSSATSSPRLGSKSPYLTVGTGRPRIRITPSIEDLGARRQAQDEVVSGPGTGRKEDWEDVASPIPSSFVPSKDSLRPSDALKLAARDRSLSPTANRSSRSKARKGGLSSLFDQRGSYDFDPSTSPTPLRTSTRYDMLTGQAGDGGLTPSSSYDALDGDCGGESETADLSMRSVGLISLPNYGTVTSLVGFRDPSFASRARTLGSELGSVLGEEERYAESEGDDTASTFKGRQSTLLSERALNSPARGRRPSERPTASLGRLVDDEEDEPSDDIDMVLSQSFSSHTGSILGSAMAIHDTDAALIATFSKETDGEWNAGEDLVEKGRLKDMEEPRLEQFDLMGRAADRLPVQWADDDDFGRPMTESEARRIGLLEAPPRTAANKPSLLSLAWVRKKQAEDGKGKAPLAPHGRLLSIEDGGQLIERAKLSELLRRKRIDALGYHGGRNMDSDVDDAYEGLSFESEVTARAMAISPARRRRQGSVMKSRGWDRKGKGKTVEPLSPVSPGQVVRGSRRQNDAYDDSIRLGSLSSSRRGQGTPKRVTDASQGRTGEQDEADSSSSDFELLEVDQVKQRPNRSGTDYYPVSLRARYRPDMVRRRMQHASADAITWITTWVTFTAVVVLAFVVAVKRGPEPVLGNPARSGRRARISN